MKFRYKVLISNIILLSIAIGIVGYFMIDKSFSLSLDSQIKNAIEENNMLQSLVEYNLLSKGNTTMSSASSRFEEVGRDAVSNMAATQASVYIVYDGELVYTNAAEDTSFPQSLCEETEIGKKGYLISENGKKKFIITASSSAFFDKKLNIINKRDITETYDLISQQANYFRILLVLVLLFCSITMYVISTLLTKPLEHLNKVSMSFGQGNYDARAEVKSRDEVGELAETYNDMAQSVSDHVDELKSMVAKRDQFVADFTHEIKTPMTSIIGYADTLRSKELSRENQIMASSYIFNEGKRLEAMSHKLFDFINTRENEIPLSPVSTVMLAEKSAESVMPDFKKKELELVVDVENSFIMGDSDLLKSAFINILDNARKASEKGSRVILSGRITDGTYIFKFQDFGKGIPEEHISKICNEFYMVDKSRSRKEGGAGLGLSLVSAIFERHHAAFKIESKVGEGTTMSVEFESRGADDEENS